MKTRDQLSITFKGRGKTKGVVLDIDPEKPISIEVRFLPGEGAAERVRQALLS